MHALFVSSMYKFVHLRTSRLLMEEELEDILSAYLKTTSTMNLSRISVYRYFPLLSNIF